MKGQNHKKKVQMIMFFLILLMISVCYIESIPTSKAQNEIKVSLEIKLHTQDESNAQRNIFYPLEKVKINAKVTFNDEPIEAALVAFQVDGPGVEPEIHQFFRSSSTNQTGIATILFTIPPSNSSNQVAGMWALYGTTTIGGESAIDELVFEVKTIDLPPDQDETTWAFLNIRELFILLLAITAISTISLLVLLKRRRKQELVPIPYPEPTISPPTPSIPIPFPTPIQTITKTELPPIPKMQSYSNIDLLISTINELENQKTKLFNEVEQLRIKATKKAQNLKSEIANIKEEIKKLKGNQ